MATVTATGGSRLVTLTGAGHPPSSTVIVSVGFTGTGPVRRFNEMRRVAADGSGNISAPLTVPFAGSVTAVVVNTSGVVQATSSAATIT